jgi:hypothetical protein
VSQGPVGTESHRNQVIGCLIGQTVAGESGGPGGCHL